MATWWGPDLVLIDRQAANDIVVSSADTRVKSQAKLPVDDR